MFALAHGGEQGRAQAAAWAELLNLNMEGVFLDMEKLGFHYRIRRSTVHRK